MLFLLRRVIMRDTWVLPALAAAFLLGLLPYLYLPLAAIYNPQPGGCVSPISLPLPFPR